MKTVAFKNPIKPAPAVAADDWVQNRSGDRETAHQAVLEPARAPEVMKRLTIDVSESLHTRMKAACALRREKMADVVRALLEREFPAS